MTIRRKRYLTPSIAIFFLGLTFVPRSSDASLLTNGSFEAPTGFAVGQEGVMPPGWDVTNGTPDLYSSDGSFGITPSSFGNFTGVTAFDGLGWAAAWSSFTETFGQQLQTTLTPSTDYKLEAHLIQAKRTDLDNLGAYDILLNASNSLSGAVEIATFAATTDSDQWEFRDAIFTAPENAGSLPWIIFRSYGNSAYPGIDELSLVVVPEPTSLTLIVLAVVLFSCRRRAI